MPRHMCRAGAARADLRKHHRARHMAAGAAPRAAPVRAAGLRFRAGGAVIDDDGRRQAHGVPARRALAVRRVRKAARPHRPPVLARTAPPAAHRAPQPGHLVVRDVRQAPRPAAHLRGPDGLQGPQAEGRSRRPAAEAEGRGSRQGGQAEAGRGRAQGTGPRPEAGRQERPAGLATARRQPRAGHLRQPRLPEVRVQGVLGRDGQLPRPPRRRITCTSSR